MHRGKMDCDNEVRRFYNLYPFPGYDIGKYNLKNDLLRYASDYAKMIYMNIPYGKKIIDIGCGTGQFTGLLGLKAFHAVGLDFSKASIDCANELKRKLALANVDFILADINNLDDISEKFDYLFCNGVLHHLKDPYKGFVRICRFLKEGSYIIIGIYNKYGRAALNIKKTLFRERFKHIAETAICEDHDIKKAAIWHLDQYHHPREKSFSASEIIKWFDKNNISYINSLPSVEYFNCQRLFARPFSKRSERDIRSSRLRCLLVQLSWIWSLRHSGGYSVFIGRR